MRPSASLSCRYIFRAVVLAMTSWACTGVLGVPPLLRDAQAATAKTGAYLPATRENYLKWADERKRCCARMCWRCGSRERLITRTADCAPILRATGRHSREVTENFLFFRDA